MVKSIRFPDEVIINKIYLIRGQKVMMLRGMVLTHKDILLKLQLENKIGQHDGIRLIFDYLKELLHQKTEPIRKIGFKHKKED